MSNEESKRRKNKVHDKRAWASTLLNSEEHLDADNTFMYSRVDFRGNQSQWKHISPTKVGKFLIWYPMLSNDRADGLCYSFACI